MVAKLARLPPRFWVRESLPIIAIGAVIGLIAWAVWLGSPTSQPPEHLEGRILTFWSTPGGKTRPSRLMIDVELPDHRRGTVAAPGTLALQCKVGDRIRPTGSHTNGGWEAVSADPQACR